MTSRVHASDIQGAWYPAVDARPGSRRDPPREPSPARLGHALSRSDSSIPLEPFPVEPDWLAAAVGGCAGVPQQRRREVASGRSLAWSMEHPDRAMQDQDAHEMPDLARREGGAPAR